MENMDGRAALLSQNQCWHIIRLYAFNVYDVLVLSIKDYGTSCHTRSPSLGSSK